MGELVDVVRRRRMTRAFDPRPVPPETFTEIVDLASRAPSAGKAQGFHLVVLADEQTTDFWDITLPVMRRGAFKWQRLLDAPLIALPFADPKAYTDRYAEPDKAATGLGSGAQAWPAPYWTIDASMAVMTMLLAAEDHGLGALFFGVFKGERELRQRLGVPPGPELLGAVAIGYPADPTDSNVPRTVVSRGRSAARSRRTPGEIIHRGRW
ncbi:MAG: nitroreductase family protein [Ilumatobacteraceae bacterium]